MALKKMVILWDLDGTLIDSAHRVNPCIREDGSFDLDLYVEKYTSREEVMKDTLLPLVELYREFRKTGFTQICMTAREMRPWDFEFLEKYDLRFDIILHRRDSLELDQVLKEKRLKEFFAEEGRIPFMAFDDKEENLVVMDAFGFRTFQAAYLNEVLRFDSVTQVWAQGLKPSQFSGGKK